MVCTFLFIIIIIIIIFYTEVLHSFNQNSYIFLNYNL